MAVASGASRNTPLSAPAGISGSLNTNFNKSANDCKQAERADHVGAAAELHRRPDLAVHQQQEGDDDEQADEHGKARHHGEDQPADPVRDECPERQGLPDEIIQHIRPHSAACRLVLVPIDFLSALISAMTAEARAIGLVK